MVLSKRRVVVTGIGCVSPLGNSAEETWKNVRDGKSGISSITLFDASTCPVQIAAEVKNFDPCDFGIEKTQLRKMARFSKFAVAASIQAVEDAGYTRENFCETNSGVIIGNCVGGMDIAERSLVKFVQTDFDYSRIPPLTTPLMLSCECSSDVCMHFNLHGFSRAVNTACASGTDAIGNAFDSIRLGRCDVCLAGGTEASIDFFDIASYYQLSALTKTCIKPFDASRDGFVVGEGSCMLFLEEYQHAVNRGAKIYAEIIGYGSSCDAYHITSQRTDGSTQALAFEVALKEAEISPEDIQYYNAHGTATIVNDLAESNMLKKVFKEHVKNLSISSTKSMTGHMLGAAGAIETMFCIKSIEDNFVPPTINLSNPDTEGGCDLNYTANTGFSKEISVAANGSFGFGGHNSCLILRKAD